MLAGKTGKVRKAVIPAAGLGTRFLPVTKTLPKEMMPIVDKPVIQYVVEEAVEAGIEEIVIVTAPGKPAIQRHFERDGMGVPQSHLTKRWEDGNHLDKLADRVAFHFVVQQQPKGLGHAIWCARSLLADEPFAVLLGDTVVAAEKPCLLQLVESFAATPVPLVGITRIPYEEANKYGMLSGSRIEERVYEVRRFVEKPQAGTSPSDLAIMGRYILPPTIFPLLERLHPGVNGEIQLTDAINLLAQRQEVRAHLITGEVYDAGDKNGFVKANVAFALQGDTDGELLRYLTRMVQRQMPLRTAKGTF
ncbi:MAG: UTP--glucose-1-phosphate uridylyltransferase [Brevibacillus sp.]|nr:UTP--glucose-1-phosphate uridylyltransferase [Brevibacillus sp.]